MFDRGLPRAVAATTIPGVTNRYRCTACGNLTRFDVVVEDEEKLAETIERVACRWCAATGDTIEEIPAAIEAPATGSPAV